MKQIERKNVKINCAVEKNMTNNGMPDTPSVPENCNMWDLNTWHNFDAHVQENCLLKSKCQIDMYDLFYTNDEDQRPIQCSALNEV